MTDKNKRIIFLLCTYLITAALFAGAGYFYAKNKYDVVVPPFQDEEKRVLRFSLEKISGEKAELESIYFELKNKPDLRVSASKKSKESKIKLNENIKQYAKIGQTDRIAFFHDLTLRLRPMPDSISAGYFGE